MAEKIQRDRGAVPPLDALMQRTADARLAQLTEALGAGFRARGGSAERQRALIRLALDFWTWRRLNREGFDDNKAAELMTDAIAAAGTAKRHRRIELRSPAATLRGRGRARPGA